MRPATLIEAMPNSPSQTHVVVVGAGVVGLAVAWRLAQGGDAVSVIDPAPGGGASYAAAGMLAPVTEVHYGEEPLLALNLESARIYPGFVAELEEATGVGVGYRECGTLAVAADADDLAWLDELRHYQCSLGLEAVRLTSQECRRREPALNPGVRGGVLVAGDHQVDPRRLTLALEAAVTQQGVRLFPARVRRIETRGGAVCGVALDDDSSLAADVIVMAAGAWVTSIGGVDPSEVPAVRPVKGQIARLRPRPGPTGLAAGLPLTGNVRAIVHGHSIYLVPRDTGELVVGATVEEQGFDTTVTAGAVLDLLRDAYALVPDVYELELAEITAGLRPATPDNAPVIGPGRTTGLVWATGHYRNGVLLAPVTAAVVAEMVAGGAVPDDVRPFAPDRPQVLAASAHHSETRAS